MEIRVLFVLKLMQKYTFSSIILFIPIILTINSFSQKTENQLVVINSIKKYKNWLDENGDLRLVLLKSLVTPFNGEVPYATKKNFTHRKLYRKHEFWICNEAGINIGKVQDSLKHLGLCLYFFDTYRPYGVTKKMWKMVPDERYAANPAKGSGHNRGVAVDVSIANLSTGKPLPMPTGFDDFSDSAHHDFMNLPPELLANRSLLKGVMEYAGFLALDTEWWHYSLPDPKRFPLLDLKFKKLKRMPPF
jgi:D-alanyl-D-alanine dipeptidase